MDEDHEEPGAWEPPDPYGETPSAAGSSAAHAASASRPAAAARSDSGSDSGEWAHLEVEADELVSEFPRSGAIIGRDVCVLQSGFKTTRCGRMNAC